MRNSLDFSGLLDWFVGDETTFGINQMRGKDGVY